MPIHRVPLGFSDSFVQSVAGFLVDSRAGHEREIDLRGTVVVHSGARAGRRILEALVLRAEIASRPLFLPRFITLSELPRVLCPELEIAAQTELEACWIEVLKAGPREWVETLVSSDQLERDSQFTYRLSQFLASLYQELSAQHSSISELCNQLKEQSIETDFERWEVLREIFLSYESYLLEREIFDTNRALRHLILSESSLDIGVEGLIFAGVLQQPRIVKELVSSLNLPTSVLVYDEAENLELYDAHGCVVADKWINKQIPMRSANVSLVADPDVQALALAHEISKLPNAMSNKDLIIAATHETFIPSLEETSELLGRPIRFAGGKQLRETELLDCLEKLSEFQIKSDFKGFSKLLQNEIVQRWLRASLGSSREFSGFRHRLISELNAYWEAHLPENAAGDLLHPDQYPTLSESHKLITGLSKQFLASEATGGGFKIGLLNLLQQLLKPYESLDLQLSQHREFAESINMIHLELHTFSNSRVFESLELGVGSCLKLFIESLKSKNIPIEPDLTAIDLVGWLEVVNDDTPYVFILGLNETMLPEVVTRDALLPDSLRQRLGLNCNLERFARDKCNLHVLLNSGREIHFFVCKRDLEGQRIFPSRFLFEVSANHLPMQVLKYYGEEEERFVLDDGIRENSSFEFKLPIRPSDDIPDITSISVTAFNSYLNCPYRFYLERILRLRKVKHEPNELSFSAYGQLIHSVLATLSRPEAQPLRSAQDIEGYLLSVLDEEFFRRDYGEDVQPFVKMQFLNMRKRLRAFSIWESGHREAGWTTKYTEFDFSNEGVILELGSEEVLQLTGRIDRIDWNQETHEWQVIDYKTNDNEKKDLIQSAYSDRAGWKDLQLPGYMHVLKQLEFGGAIKLSYLNLPTSSTPISAKIAEWSDEELKDAYDLMQEIGRNIRAKIFWPPKANSFGREWDEYADLF